MNSHVDYNNKVATKNPKNMKKKIEERACTYINAAHDVQRRNSAFTFVKR